ncbi:MAG: tRNA uridine-5-carboxymethylaminomethyl(34) synthesis enzyme MnmG [Deltaproteobacteria bacterium]|nr:tRNA uridine-5-carboxymethylaminomethyl(34) synthesis enzyme MnmG [Deltaproteobacteria bacterium]
MRRKSDFDIIVVGGGHAGIEAALSCSRLQHKVLLVTSNLSRIGYMSCNPSIGGLAKGHMVRELDVLGGQMAQVADETCLQFKRLNSSRGPAVRGSRVQSDKIKYSRRMIEILDSQENLSLLESEVKSLILNGNLCEGVVLEDHSFVHAKRVILTTGTFMNGVMHFGLKQIAGGRIGDKSSIGLSDQLRDFGFSVKRLKTGTPARLLKDSIDWSKTSPQYGDNKFFPFSLKTKNFPVLPQVTCFLSRTTEQTHEIIRKNLDKSPMFCGIIEGIGPRYCPSIEDKITRFSDRDSHQTFLEPESLESDLIYLQGISTSLPEGIQQEFLQTIPGLENVKVARYGYAVEYDYFEPTQIEHSLESRPIRNLFLAGQINGTSGYEEAAAQGLIAGINASRSILSEEPLVLKRDQAYIGVLIDDLVTKGTSEPYRMFTSRAEHRLVLREDNTYDRLDECSKNIGLLGRNELDQIQRDKQNKAQAIENIKNFRLTPTGETQEKLRKLNTSVLLKSISLEEFLRRPEISNDVIFEFFPDLKLSPSILESIEIEIKYSGYIKRQLELINQMALSENFQIPKDIEYSLVKGLSREEIEKLSRIKPLTLGQAQRISGVNPSAIQAIVIYIKGHGSKKSDQIL